MWTCVRIEPAGFNVVSHSAYFNALLLGFSQVSEPDEDTETHGRRPLVAYCVGVCVRARMCLTFARMVLMDTNVKIVYACDLGPLDKFRFIFRFIVGHYLF